MKRPLILFFGALVLIAIGIYLTSSTGDETADFRRPVASPELELESTKEELVTHASPYAMTQEQNRQTQEEALAMLRDDLAELRKNVAVLQRKVDDHWHMDTAAAAWAEHAETTDMAGKDPAAREQEEIDRLQQMDSREADFWREPVDTGWSFEAVTAVEEVLADKETMFASVQSIDCRSFTCRIDIQDDGTGELDKIVPLFIHELPETLSNVTTSEINDGEGTRSMILYVSREANAPQ